MFQLIFLFIISLAHGSVLEDIQHLTSSLNQTSNRNRKNKQTKENKVPKQNQIENTVTQKVHMDCV